MNDTDTAPTPPSVPASSRNGNAVSSDSPVPQPRAPGNRRAWSVEHRRAAVDLMNEVGVAAASKRLGIAQSTLYNWRSATASGAVRSRVGDETRAAQVVELVKATPPPRGSLAEQLRPLLEQIMAAADHDWFRVVVFPTRNQAERHGNRIRGRYPPQWEWRSATVGDKSALYVRWLDRGEPDIRIEVG